MRYFERDLLFYLRGHSVLRLDPRNVNLLTQHALSYVCLRRFPEAMRNLDQVLNITPDDVDTVG